MSPREKFRRAYRIGRLLPRQPACMAEVNRFVAEVPDPDGKVLAAGFTAATRARCGEWLFGLQASRKVAGEGRSRSKCIALCLRAVKYRHDRRLFEAAYQGQPYFPATKFHLSPVAR